MKYRFWRPKRSTNFQITKRSYSCSSSVSTTALPILASKVSSFQIVSFSRYGKINRRGVFVRFLKSFWRISSAWVWEQINVKVISQNHFSKMREWNGKWWKQFLIVGTIEFKAPKGLEKKQVDGKWSHFFPIYCPFRPASRQKIPQFRTI